MKKPKAKPNKAIKLSFDVVKTLNHKRKGKNKIGADLESYDSVLRRMLVLYNRYGSPNRVRTFYVLTKPKLQVYQDHAEAKGQAILNAVRNKHLKAERPIAVREII